MPRALTTDELEGLAFKYQALTSLRLRRDAGGPAPERARLRDIAERFPGALRELDTLGLPALRARAAAAARAAAGGPREAWMDWIGSYHALIATGLALKREKASTRGGTLRPATQPARRSAAQEIALARQLGFELDPETVQTLARPPGGRLSPLVIRLLALRFDVSAATIAATLFPTRRPSPYTL